MAVHPFVFASSLAVSGLLQPVNPVADGLLQLSGTQFFLVPQGVPNNAQAPPLKNVLLAYARGANLHRVQVFTPTLSELYLPEITPIDVGGLVAGRVNLAADLRANPLVITPTEQLGINALMSGGVAEVDQVVLFVGDAVPAPVKASGLSVRVSATIAAVANTWVNGINLTFDQQLKPGNYQVIGARFKSATGVVARMLFPGAYYRTPVLMVQNDQDPDPPMARMGDGGVFGVFNNVTPPTVDVFCTAADTALTGVLDLVGPTR